MYSYEIMQGMIIGLSLIIAIGPQNLFVINQGLKKDNVFLVCAICSLSDSLLIIIGIFISVYISKISQNSVNNLNPEISILSLTNDLELNQLGVSGYSIKGVKVEARILGGKVFSGSILDNAWNITLPNSLISGKQILIVNLINKEGLFVKWFASTTQPSWNKITKEIDKIILQ